MDKRPWPTLAIDVFTRMVVGFHLSMDKPSRVSLGLCMLNAGYDKSAWLNEREIDASSPAAGSPDAVHSDNGADFRSHAFAWACREEGIKLIFRPIGAPHYGGHIERLIRTMMGRVHFYPGSTFANPNARQDNDPARFAAMTFASLDARSAGRSPGGTTSKSTSRCSDRPSGYGVSTRLHWLCACPRTAWPSGSRFSPSNS